MADCAGSRSAGLKAGTRRRSRNAAGTKQTSTLKQEDASKRKAELEAAVRKKIEFERKALHIVEQLLEENITEEFLMEGSSLHLLTTVMSWMNVLLSNSVVILYVRRSWELYQNRNIKFLPKPIKSMILLKGRHPDFQLLKEGQSGHSGIEVELCSKAIKTSDIDNPSHFEKQYESSSSSTHSDSSSDNEQDFVSSILPGNRPSSTSIRPQLHQKSIMKKKAGHKANSIHKDKEQTVVDVTEQLGNCKLDSQEKAATGELPLQKVITENSSNSTLPERLKASDNSESKYSRSEITLVGISKKSAEHFKRKFAKSNQVSRSVSGSVQMCPEVGKRNLLKILKETLIEWKTEETLKFLYGQNYASVCLKPEASLVKEELDEDDIISDPDSHSLAWRESQNSLDESLPFMGSDTAIKPLPSYENLKKETEKLNLRIREFYRGRYVLDEETTKSQDSEEHDSTFPLIDSSSQNQIRKRIVLEKLSKVLPGLLGPLQITLGDIYTQLKNLVRTFRLTNRNIIHKPAEWTLIAMVLLSLLTPILGIQKHSQEGIVFTRFLDTLLEELQLKNEDLESLTIIFRTSCLPK
ncbi:putative RNA polymerase II subunit B1 CTD phosphatase RPAP2 isoform X3 [Cebus imitator]|uniref:putative RNA polymerase II subunit B1 CTD phosphatase RPAP2 isoform X3 n=2 Tax=Cebus imitator TaxID=2715852 RepID=UPI00189A9878|nr:putative RNA polymerase II subunit B1 CTD phosphatase RPAP2 isoform X3 [Cebus imitator]